MEKGLRRISVVGLGKLGLPLAACFAGKGFSVIGLDEDSSKVKAVNEGISLIYEPGLQDIIRASQSRLRATQDYVEAVIDSDVTFILVPTPSGKDDTFSLQYVIGVVEQVGEAIRDKPGYHLVVITSTVMPGATQKELKPLLEARSNKRCGKDFGLCYNPEFVALGSVVHDLLNPDFILIGESDSNSGSILSNLYRHFCENNPPMARMSLINAELTKLALNSYITTKITFANSLACICERLPGADADVVSSALGLDSRIGRKYLKGAIGYGGPCFPRDNLAFIALARSLGLAAILAQATSDFNQQQVFRLKEIIKGHLSQDSKVGILGLAYKPNSDVVEEAQGVLLAQALVNDGVTVIAYDPVAMDNARPVLGNSVNFASSVKELIYKSDIVIVTTPWDEFKKISYIEFARPNQPRVLIDCWRLFDNMKREDGIIYVALGVGGLNRR